MTTRNDGKIVSFHSKCKGCDHPVGDHIDIASYRMDLNQDDFRWCYSLSNDCDCTISYDNFLYGKAEFY